MKNILKKALIPIGNEKYLSLLIILAPCLNFLAGITFDLHAPSLPAIAAYYGASAAAVKNTITFSLIGFAVGAIIFGSLLDTFGRRPIIFFGLLIYTLASFSALLCGNIQELLLIRFIQGFAVASLSIGGRTILIDSFTGHQFKIGMLYSSLGFGLGPIIAPFIGGYLQYHFGWQANFIAYGAISLIFMIMFTLYIEESKPTLETFVFRNLMSNYAEVLKHISFLPAVIVAGLTQVQLLVYTTTGSFVIENILHRSAIAYGNSALIVSCGYLLGTTTNRFLIKSFTTHQLICFGFVLSFTAVIMQFVFFLIGQFNLFTLIFPVTLIGFSTGFIFINVFTACLRVSNRAVIATALFTSGVMGIGALGTGVVSHITINNLADYAGIFGVAAMLEFAIYSLIFSRVVRKLD